jgi:NAD(P)H-flavin reductase
MIKPCRSSVFLGRPFSAALWEEALKDEEEIRRRRRRGRAYIKYVTSNTVTFLIARRGKGTGEILALRLGDRAELSGPLGNSWTDFLPPVTAPGDKPLALVAGGIGVAPLSALAAELAEDSFDFYLGLRTGFKTMEEKAGLLGPALLNPRKLIIASEDGKEGLRGKIPDFLENGAYRAVFACGPEPMLKAAAAKCRETLTPCYISLERRMACGAGACLGCTVTTTGGNRRCCADGPVFNAEEVIFDE